MSPSTTQHSHREESPGVHVKAQADRTDDTIVAELGQTGGSNYFVGLAVRQNAPSIDDPRTGYRTIKANTGYYILDCGEVDLDIPAGLGFTPEKGTRLWIDPATQILYNATSTGRLKVGEVRYLGPERGLATTMWTVSFDARKDF